jgi:protocatechuate 3,4-dioxygenase beta subunit
VSSTWWRRSCCWQPPTWHGRARRRRTWSDSQSPDSERQPLATSSSVALPAWRLEGRIVDAQERPIPGARIELTSLCSGVEDGPAGSSREDGHYVVDLSPWQERSRFENGNVTLYASVRAPGFHVASKSISLGDVVQNSTDLSEVVLKQDFTLTKGSVLTGRVIDSKGAPVPHAFAYLHVGKRRSVARANPRGQYWINVPGSGHGYILVDQPAVGTGMLPDIRLAEDQDQTVPDVVLLSHGAIHGVLMYDDGQPIAGREISIEAVATNRKDLKVVTGTFPSIETDLGIGPGYDPGEFAKGLTAGAALTGDDGSFVIRGLRPGRYRTMFRAKDATRSELRVFETETDQAPLEIRLDYHRLTVRVFDPEGKRVEHPDCGWIGWRPDKDALIRRLAGGEPVFEKLTGDVAAGGQIHDVFVSRGSWWLVSAEAQGHHAWQLLTADGPTHETQVDLRLRAGPKDARLRITVSSPADGGPMPFKIRLRRALPGFRACEEEVGSTDGAKVYRCNPGTFLLTIQPAPTNGSRLPSSYREIRRQVKLESHQETELRVVAEQGGRVSLLVHTPEGWKGDGTWRVAAKVPGAPGQEPRDLKLYLFVEDSERQQIVRMGAYRGPVNKRVTCEGVLSPGKHVVTVETKGFKSQQVAVEIFAGKVTDAEVWLTDDDIEAGKGR